MMIMADWLTDAAPQIAESRGAMGTVIRFPQERRIGVPENGHARSEPGAVIILPVIRIERHVEEPSTRFAPEAGTPRGNRRRRPGRRS